MLVTLVMVSWLDWCKWDSATELLDFPDSPYSTDSPATHSHNSARENQYCDQIYLVPKKINLSDQNVLNFCQCFPLCAGPLFGSSWSHSWRLGVEVWDAGRETPFIPSAISLMIVLLPMLVLLLILLLISLKMNIFSLDEDVGGIVGKVVCEHTPVH